MAELEILPNQIWKSKYADIYYKVFGGSTSQVEMYNIDDIWECILVSKEDLKTHFILN